MCIYIYVYIYICVYVHACKLFCVCVCVHVHVRELVCDFIYFSRLIAFDNLPGGNLGFLVHSENQQEHY